jgi:endonuclease-3
MSGTAAVLAAIERSAGAMTLPAVEKISDDSRRDPFKILISTLLSAQTRDPVTHAASQRLFAAGATPAALAALPVRRIARLIYPVSFYRTKARHVRDASRQLVERFAGRVPATMDELLSLPGVGRKTANLVLILAHASRDSICVDTHVHRISNRLGWVTTRSPEETEQALYRVVPRRWWPKVNLLLVTWGQNVCRPISPRCGACVVARRCPYPAATTLPTGGPTR